ncbi:MAG: hypothetical protein GQF41_1032 [Candidatus Rifleibacterium amylolyticum]|nr:MAG: hypothetical protein GQF41_1032 [Candidatus Rifleibacterium amylolyticum]NLF98233.1 hypothetical protein [Candidatus Riflebacteria bacterium]
MIKNKRLLRSVSLVLSLILLLQAFFISAGPQGRLFAEEEESEFSASEALAPGEYLEQVTGLMGGNTEEIESHSYAQWTLLLMNTLIMLDPKGTDVMTFQHSITKTLSTVNKVRGFAADLPKYVGWVEKIAAFGFKYFPGSGANKFHQILLKVQNAMGMLGKTDRLRTLQQTATYMKSPYSKGVGACKQWYKKGTPLVDGSQQLSGLQTGAMKVGSVLQIISGIMELSRVPGALANDAGTPSFETVQIAINGAILIATALMAWPPPGAWTVAAFIIIGAWELIKGTLNKIGDTIEKWHKSYADSLNFLRETDDKFAAFYDENIDANSCPMPGDDSPLIDPLERSAALVFADELKAALEENPGEGDIAERQQELVKNIRAQGILSTWYYQQDEATRLLPPNIEDLYLIWNHRADYMAFKPKKPSWSWNPINLIGDGLGWLAGTALESFLGTHDQFVDDKGKFKELALFCPDFALTVLFRRYVTSQAHSENIGEIPEHLSLTGVRIEQAPFNYMPLIEIYNNNFSNWSTEIIGQAFAADAFMTAAKEMPYLTEQLNYARKNNEQTTMHTLAKAVGAVIIDDDPKEIVLGILADCMLKQLEGSARMRAQFDALLAAYNEDKNARIKDKEVDYSFNGDSDDFKLGKEIFKGKKMHDELGPFVMNMGVAVPEFWSGILKGEDEKEEPEQIFREYSGQLQTSLQLNLNSLGISGIDMVKFGIQLKNEIDVLELAKDNLKDKKQALDSINEIFTNEAIRKLVTKGEFLDVSRDWLSNFLSSYDPPEDIFEHNIGKLEDAIEKLEESINKRKEIFDTLHPLIKSEYAGWLETYKNYEEAADELGISLTIRSSDSGYAKRNLELLAPISALDPSAAPAETTR